MPVLVSTNSVTLDINALFDNVRGETPISAKDALTGKFTQRLVQTPDYAISLLTYVGYQVEDGPSDGVEYEVELYATGKVRKFSFVDEMLTFIDLYLLSTHKLTRITFSLADLAREQYELKRKGSSGRYSVAFKGVAAFIAEVDDIDAERPTGFIKTDAIPALQPLFATLKAELR